MSSKNFNGGVPTDVDVKALREAYPEHRMEPEMVIPYAEAERLLKLSKGSNRFRGVTGRWRKLVEAETGMVIGVERGEGFKVLNEPEKIDLSGSKLRSAARAAHRSYEVGSLVDVAQLTHEDRRRLNFYTLKSAKLIAAAQVRSGKNLLPDLEVK